MCICVYTYIYVYIYIYIYYTHVDPRPAAPRPWKSSRPTRAQRVIGQFQVRNPGNNQCQFLLAWNPRT